MKQKYFIFNLLLKIWFGILCASLLCTLGITWLTAQSTKPVPNDNLDTTYKGMLLTWSILGVLILSVGSTTLFLNCFAKIRRNSLCSFLSFFIIPILILLFSGTMCLYNITIPFLLCLLVSYMLFRNKIIQKQTNKSSLKG
ncbi:hypothetical protein HMPREF1536_05033 [Parabacteroides gordonii MS-1 = DSM 23371]|jgi:hypothetical protein|uniref:Uncharacterized protein n=1 Tax=Parabacteroides gordonii MS-1 = DSM 23371 TaxID=1203610 RepID=A0A0F5IP92_9BACT|nr:hypothetical protein HMPREF1536_05033 [Parabacteroides gordonii MS-1 = DSM 23371]